MAQQHVGLIVGLIVGPIVVLSTLGACSSSGGQAGPGAGGAGAGSTGATGTGGAGVGGAAGTRGTAGAGGGSGSIGGAAGSPAVPPAGAGGARDAGSADGTPTRDGATSTDVVARATCSDPGGDPMPVAGFVKATPRDMRFPFSTHWMGVFSANSRCISMTSLTDIDKDGDQDFASGQRDVACSGQTNPNNPMIWWEYCSPDHWVKHNVGTGFRSAAAGGAADVDGDGFIDLLAGDSWFKNPGAGVRTAAQWMRYATGAPGNTEEITMGDVNGDGKLDALHVVSSFAPQWWTPGPDATKPWIKGAELRYAQQQGGAIGDLDGDGRNDILVGDRWWYKRGADPSMWTPVAIARGDFAPTAPAAGSAPLTTLGDMDGDGDMDIVMATHWGGNVAWIENQDGKGTMMVTHMIAGPGAPFATKRAPLHNMVALDFDNDGDLDVFAGENEGSQWMYENTNGKGSFAEHMFATGPGHEARAADVDCDGDLDIAGKPWGDLADGPVGRTETLRAHVYYKNELVERGGTPVFVRPKGEVWNVPNKGACK